MHAPTGPTWVPRRGTQVGPNSALCVGPRRGPYTKRACAMCMALRAMHIARLGHIAFGNVAAQPPHKAQSSQCGTANRPLQRRLRRALRRGPNWANFVSKQLQNAPSEQPKISRSTHSEFCTGPHGPKGHEQQQRRCSGCTTRCFAWCCIAAVNAASQHTRSQRRLAKHHIFTNNLHCSVSKQVQFSMFCTVQNLENKDPKHW